MKQTVIGATILLAVGLLTGCNGAKDEVLPNGTKLFGERTLKHGTRTAERVELSSKGEKDFNVTFLPDGSKKTERVEYSDGEKQFGVTHLPDGSKVAGRVECPDGRRIFNEAWLKDGTVKAGRLEFPDGSKQFDVTLVPSAQAVPAVPTGGSSGWSVSAGELGDAAAKGQVKRVQQLIAAGANVNAMNREGNTLLNLADENWSGDKEHEDVILALVDAGANVNVPGKLGILVVFTAAHQGQLSVVKKLVERGANLSFETKKGSIYGDGRRPLDLARSPEVWQYLRAKGAESGRTDYDKALCDAAQEGLDEAVTYFLQRGGNLNARFDETLGGFTVMKMGGFNIPSLRVVKYRGMTALHYACFGGAESVVRLLVEKGADVNTPDADGQTPLDFALFRGHEKIVSYLRSVKASEGVGGERMHIRAAIENMPTEGFHRLSACSVTRSYNFSKERPDIKPQDPQDTKGTAITFKAEFGGWDDEPVSFRNGMIGSSKAIRSYVREGTEARYLGKRYRFESGNWVEAKE